MSGKNIQIQWRSELEFGIVVVGIYCSYLYFGILQEKIYNTPGRDIFPFPEVVVLSQCIAGLIVGYSSKMYTAQFLPFVGSNKMPQISLLPNLPQPKLQVLHSLAFVLAMLFTNLSLEFVSYPTQALAKSCKILPVMLGTLFVKLVRYHPSQYLSVALVTTGILSFNLMKVKGEGDDSGIGLLFLFGALLMDGLSGYCTEQSRHELKPTGPQMMHYCNFYGAIILLFIHTCCTIFLHSRSLVSYVAQFPDILNDLIVFGLLSGMGQIFIFRGASILGTLTLNIITTTRKFMTVILSIILFEHTLNLYQWLSLILVFSGTMIDFYMQFFGKPKSKKHEGTEPQKSKNSVIA